MRENEANMGRIQPAGSNEERERERWSLMRAARDEADRSLALAANLADKEAALAHAHATIKEVIPAFPKKYIFCIIKRFFSNLLEY